MLLSIAIPAYNAERSLERTVRSVLAQTHRDLEVLVVNNGSVDGTGDLAKRLAKEDDRIKVFDVYPNVGGYGARLYAWRRAKGDYIATVDADDVIEPDMYEQMIALAVWSDLDVVECDWVEGMASPSPAKEPPDVYETKEEVFEKVVYPTFVSVGKSAYTWNKIYRNQYDFSEWEEGDFGSYEDLIHNLQLFRPVKNYGHIHAGFYHYMPSDSSVTRNFSLGRLNQFSNAIKVKRRLVGAYGIKPDDCVLDHWVLNDARNALASAVVCNTDVRKAEIVHRVFAMRDVADAFARLRKIKEKSVVYRQMSLAAHLPSWLVVVMLKLARKFM